MSGNDIKVVCRFRPQNALEIKEGGIPIIDITEDGSSVALKGKEFQGSFAFDMVYGSNTPQKDVFDYSVKSIVDDVTAGYNGTVFAYGQTGSGKTYTMMGSNIDNEQSKGITPRIVEQIFESIMESSSNIEFTVRVSYMEIYMERVRDLLNPDKDNLAIHEDKQKGIYVKDLLEVYVGSSEEVYEVMRRGGNNRVVAYTNMNAESSRSHSIVQITITQKNVDTGAAKSGKLYLVDLAGSEKVGKTGAFGQTLEEAKKINKSLTALGMVINALTDGKANHIPYRDSKLTRILQESLGGNSRTTLIINCSPSSYNEAETLGTLRFGMRAKTIKNKAKVNADLSPAELKALLKKVKSETLTFQTYITALEGEVSLWRAGMDVPEDRWVTMDKVNNGVIKSHAPAQGFKSPVGDDASRPPTPAIVLEKDEREEFLKRENELMDQITNKESELSGREKLLESLKEEMTYYKEHEQSVTKGSQQLTSVLSDLRLQLQKISYESREKVITVDSLKEANQNLMVELEELKKNLVEVGVAHREATGSDKENQISEKERQIRNALHRLEDDHITAEDLAVLRRDLADSKALMDQHSKTIRDLMQEKGAIERKKLDLETRLTTFERECEDLLDKTIGHEKAQNKAKADLSEAKNKLEAEHLAKKELQQKNIDELKKALEAKDTENERLSKAMADLKAANEQLQTKLSEASLPSSPTATNNNLSEKEKEVVRMRKSMAQQLADFEVMKKAFMRDLQSRCERVVELELSLDETREHYNHHVLKTSNNKAQKKKMAFLERNLEQLTHVQKQLVDQNASLKKEVALAERKLIARNERTHSLEALLQDSQERLISQNQEFEAQIQAAQGRLDARTQQRPQGPIATLPFSRIAKPLRGGQDIQDSEGNSPISRDKRTSWIFGLMASR